MAVAASSQQIHIRPAGGRHIVRAGGAVIADSGDVLELCEGDAPPVLYFPREDVAMDLLERLEATTACPHKGLAVAFAVVTPSGRIAPAAWSYEAPRQTLGAIAGRIAFHPAKVSVTAG